MDETAKSGDGAETDGKRGRRKGRAGDRVYLGLATSILRGSRPSGSSMPAEAEVALDYGVSKPVVRQAMHRLAAAGLISIRQGGLARVQSPWFSGSIAVIELVYRMATKLGNKERVLASVLEKQYTQGLSMLEVYARRATSEQKTKLLDEVRRIAGEVTSAAGVEQLETTFWGWIARQTGNRIFELETTFWYGTLQSRPRMPKIGSTDDHVRFYVELARRLADGDDALAFYMQAMAPVMRLVWSFESEETTKSGKRRAARGAR